MTKYIDADRLRKELDKRLKNVRDYINGEGMKYKGPKYHKAQGKESAYDALLSFVDSLQQETEQNNTLAADSPATNEEIQKMLEERRLEILRAVNKEYNHEFNHIYDEAYNKGYADGQEAGIEASLRQEKQEVDLEEEISRTYHDGSVTNTSDMDHVAYENIASYFYRLGLKAR